MQDIGEAVPGRYPVAIAAMQEMGWSWPELLAAPADLVEEILERRAARVHWEGVRAKLDAQKAKQKRGRARG